MFIEQDGDFCSSSRGESIFVEVERKIGNDFNNANLRRKSLAERRMK
jgi:hypothetical protein